MKRLIAGMFLLGCGTTFAQALQLPTDTDLRAAYCVRVLQHVISNLNDMSARLDGSPQIRDLQKKLLQERRGDLNRVQSYLLPRMSQLDADGLLLAANRGDIDAKDADAADLDRCSNECDAKAPFQQNSEAWSTCTMACYLAIPVIKRTRACYEITWLPF